MATETTIKSGSTIRTTLPAQAADLEAFQKTPYYQNLGIERLEEQVKAYDADDRALRSQAEAEYEPGYRTESEAVRQQLDREVQALEGQKSGVSAAYDKQRRQTDRAYDESAVDLNNELNKRGLGRSSLVSTQGAYLQQQRNRALSDIGEDESRAISAINERIALLTGQAAEEERTLSGNYARRLEARVNELKEKNRNASVSLQLQIAALQQQGYEAYQDWLLKNRAQELEEREYEARYGAEEEQSPAGGSTGAANRQTNPAPQASTPTKQTGRVVKLNGADKRSEKKQRAADLMEKFKQMGSESTSESLIDRLKRLGQLGKR